MWTDEAWKAIEPIYEKILDLEFVKELGDGSLAQDKFVTYMVQDKLYLNDYARALAIVGSRAPDVADVVNFSQFSQNAAVAEQGLHDFYISHVGDANANKALMANAQKNVTCELYTSFLLKHAALSPIEVAAAAVLPCFWIYEKVGDHHTQLLKQCKEQGGKPHAYSRWIELYSSADFNADAQKARDFCNRLADASSEDLRKQMIDAFVKASIMELMFWNAAWIDEKWIT